MPARMINVIQYDVVYDQWSVPRTINTCYKQCYPTNWVILQCKYVLPLSCRPVTHLQICSSTCSIVKAGKSEYHVLLRLAPLLHTYTQHGRRLGANVSYGSMFHVTCASSTEVFCCVEYLSINVAKCDLCHSSWCLQLSSRWKAGLVTITGPNNEQTEPWSKL